MRIFIALLVTGLFFLFNPQSGNAQSTTEFPRIKKYKVWVKRYRSGTIKGYLTDVQKDTVKIAMSEASVKYAYAHIAIPVNQIEVIKVRRWGKVSRRILLGMLAGFGAGAAFGAHLIRYDFSSYFSVPFVVILGGLAVIPGGIIGGMSGLNRIDFPIRGDKKYYESHRALLSAYILK